jgi:hypothetical protein
MSVACLHGLWLVAWPLRQELLAARRGLLAALTPYAAYCTKQAVRVSTTGTGHQGSQYLLQGKRTYQYSELARASSCYLLTF